MLFSDIGGTAGEEGQKSWFLLIFLDTTLDPRGTREPGLKCLLEGVSQQHTGLEIEELHLCS